MANSCSSCCNRDHLLMNTLFDILAIVSPIIDLGCDIWTAIRYYERNYMIEFSCIVVFIIIATLVNTIVYFRMSDHNQDEDKQKSGWYRWLCGILFWLGLSTLIYPLHALMYRIKVWRTNDENKIENYNKKIYSFKSDASLLNLLEFALEAAPQFVLKCCVLIKIIDYFNAKRIESSQSYPTLYDINSSYYNNDTTKVLNPVESQSYATLYDINSSYYNNDTKKVLNPVENEIWLPDVFDYITMLVSAALMGLALALYQRSIRLAQDKAKLDVRGTICLCIAHFLLSLSQCLSLSLVTYLFPKWTVYACIVHAGFSVCYLYKQGYRGLDFCKGPIGAFIFSIVLGVVYIFTFLQVVDEPTQKTSTVYYVIRFVEIVICCCVWYFNVNDVTRSKLAYVLIGIIVSSFGVGIITLISYYKCLHPKLNNIEMTYPTETIPLYEQIHVTDQQSDLSKPKVPKVGGTEAPVSAKQSEGVRGRRVLLQEINNN